MNINPHHYHYVISPNGLVQDEADMHAEALSQSKGLIELIEKGTTVGLSKQDIAKIKEDVNSRKQRMEYLASRFILGRNQEELAKNLCSEDKQEQTNNNAKKTKTKKTKKVR